MTTIERLEAAGVQRWGEPEEVQLTKLCEAACGHARVGKLDAADLALSEAIALAVCLGYDSCHRVLYAARVVQHCRVGARCVGLITAVYEDVP